MESSPQEITTSSQVVVSSESVSFGQLMKNFGKECVAGSIGGISGIFVGHPLDTIRVRLQTQTSSKFGAIHFLKEAVAKEGARSLFKGLLSPLIGEAINNCILFGVYNGLLPNVLSTFLGNLSEEEQTMIRRTSIPIQFASGSLAGFCIAFVVCPTELIKIRLQTSTDHITTRATSGTLGRRGFMDCAKFIWKYEGGLRGIYHGYSSTLIRELSFNGVYFATYEQCKTRFSRYLASKQMEGADEEQIKKKIEELRSDWRVILTSGGLAGLSAWGLCYQTDVVKSLIQSRSPVAAARGEYSVKVIDVFNECRKSKSLFKGLAPTLVRAVPVNAVTFLMVEAISRYLNDI
ncbi:hypothetical protein C9374_008590 [Naegleria lovaniensis]|uniref:Mitochondrial carrier protein n=1 Tax=Naegleria lovaniensis TaxID=51637 RepID=A0AA88KHL9_NAELO|nr:uncharacterized protein C9374_008590 [Naegleria lovaniensis]KAG2377968.1 hypothetical protein C9374_008590 [Naegleria lovaniensis]